MPVEVHLDGQLSPTVLNEPFYATHTNMVAALKQGHLFFLSKDMEKNTVSIHIPKILFMREIDED